MHCTSHTIYSKAKIEVKELTIFTFRRGWLSSYSMLCESTYNYGPGPTQFLHASKWYFTIAVVSNDFRFYDFYDFFLGCYMNASMILWMFLGNGWFFTLVQMYIMFHKRTSKRESRIKITGGKINFSLPFHLFHGLFFEYAPWDLVLCYSKCITFAVG